ncbi:MAG TPA: secretin N-terminal domain-containing protein, partial [Sphingorhabdus sp.]|nr:secretin N-terminal domain-containing protein [Sphingorhabdus sp.]
MTTFAFRVFSRWLLPFALAFGLSLPAHAQTPSVVEELLLVTEDADQASYIIRFSPQEPQASPLNNDPSRPAVAMKSTLRARRVAEFNRYRGLVRSARFETTAGNLILRFDTAAPANVSVQPAGNKAFQIRVQRVSAEEATGTRPIGSQNDPVFKASDLSTAQDSSINDSYELIPLKYADVSEIIGLLVEGATAAPNDVFIRREPGFGSPGSNSQNNYFNPQQQQPQENRAPLGQSFGNGMAIDRRLNAIWVTGTPEKIARIKEQIALIDVPVDSVILETQFVELTENGAKNLGIDLTNNAGQLAVGTLQTGSFLPFGVDPNDVLPSGALQAAIYAQVERGEGRIVSRPRIAALSGSTAKIITGDALPILTSITLSGVNGVSQQVQYVNVGVTLQIAPRVSADGFVTSQIYGVVSSVTGFSQGYPTISQREAETSASVRDGETFVVGGLTQENVITNKSKVPLLGDIPLVGNLFKLERSTR